MAKIDRLIDICRRAERASTESRMAEWIIRKLQRVQTEAEAELVKCNREFVAFREAEGDLDEDTTH